MPEITRSAMIDAEPRAIWQMVSDPAQAPRWMPDLKERRLLTAGGLDAGSQWEDHGLLRGKAYRAKYQVIEWNPPHHFAYQQISSSQAGYVWIERVSVAGESGGTRVTLSLNYEMPGGLAGKLYEKLIFRKDFGATLENRLEALRELAA